MSHLQPLQFGHLALGSSQGGTGAGYGAGGMAGASMEGGASSDLKHAARLDSMSA